MAMPEKMAQLIAIKLAGENNMEENLSCRASVISSRHSPELQGKECPINILDRKALALTVTFPRISLL